MHASPAGQWDDPCQTKAQFNGCSRRLDHCPSVHCAAMSREGDLFILRGSPEYIRLDNGAEFIAKKVRAGIGAVGAKTAFIAPGSPLSGHRPAMPCRAAHGKTATARASTLAFGPLGRLLCNRLPGNRRTAER
jgi:hypothetical protein